ncbi:PPC domain-containing protein [Pontiellaceae bacterium B1224]|nr:PPC domain-containing protein [Pontiellaceae bacterium B1224]
MNVISKRWIFFCGVILSGAAWASNEPHIGFAFPAGAQQGSTFSMELGGQHFNNATNVYVSGEGVEVEILDYAVKYEPRRVGQIYRNKENALALLDDKDASEKSKQAARKKLELAEKQIALLDLPEGVDRNDKKAVQKLYRNNTNTKEQFNPQLQDRLRVQVKVGKKAPPGERELRVYTPQGLSNPVYFQVGSLEEVREAEPNDDHMSPDLQMVPVPSVINGQIRPGDMDHFRFSARKGESIVVDVAARRIIPYLADAVPGWFQAVVALYDEDGKEVAYQDDYKFNPDPVLFFEVPAAGVYTLSIRDSIYRGREDFIYRIAIGELPFITGIFPLGAREGADVDIALSGWNLPKPRLTGNLPSDGFELRHISVVKDGYRSNQMPFAIGEMEEILESEPNDEEGRAQPVKHPLIINGRIGQAGDRDVFSFQGTKGDSVSIEVIARRLNSPLDSNLMLTGPGMEKPVRNDDLNEKDNTHLHLGAGLITHHADSYLLHELPATGTYFVEIADAQNKGGHDYAYRLRISPSNPDFKLRMEPSGIQIAPGGTAAFTVRALRQDGYQNKITLEATQLPEGFVMSEAVIPKGSDMTRFTITAPAKIEGGLVSPQISGTGIMNGKSVTRPAVPVDDQMQAFLYRHLVPAKELVLAPVSKRPPVSFEARIPKIGIIEMQAGKETRIGLTGRVATGAQRGYSVKLNDPPEGFSTEKSGWIGKQKLKEKDKNGNVRFEKNKAAGSIVISVDESVKPGTLLSLVLEAEVRNGKDKTYFPAPAIPVKVVKAKD